MKFPFALLITTSVFAADFKELSKSEAKEFARAAEAISQAMKEERFIQIRTFGPGILKQYASIQIQSDSYALKLRDAYARTDSIVAYTVFRLVCDSLSANIDPAPSFDMTYSNMMAADKIHHTLISNPIMKAFHLEYADSMIQRTEAYITRQIPIFNATAKKIGRPDQAGALLNALTYQPPLAEKTRFDINASIRKAYYTAMSSNSIEKIEGFAQLYPDYERQAVQDRLGRLRGDEVAYLLRKGSMKELMDFLTRFPTSPNAPDLRQRLKPMLYRLAQGTQDLLSCQQFLQFFPEPSFEKSTIMDLQNQIMAQARTASPAPDTTDYLNAPAVAP